MLLNTSPFFQCGKTTVFDNLRPDSWGVNNGQSTGIFLYFEEYKQGEQYILERVQNKNVILQFTLNMSKMWPF